MDNNQIVVTDDQGVDHTLQVLFTFNSEETGKKYVLYFDPEQEEPTVFASSFDEEGKLFEVESPDEWEMIEEVFQSFMAQDEGECSCGGNCGEDHECDCDGDHDGGCCCGDEGECKH